MNFVNTSLLVAGLACVSLPILIHILMRRRRKPVMWGAMEWLLQAYRQQRRRTRLEQMVLLASRCLLVALVALALGKPLLGALSGGGLRRSKTLSIVLDNSLASQASLGGAEGSALEASKARAMKLVDALDAAKGDRCALVLMGSPPQSLVVPASADLAEVKRLIGQVQVTDTAADLPGAIEVLRGAAAQDAASTSGASGDTDQVVAILSESREGSVALTQPLPSLAAAIAAATRSTTARVQVIASAPAKTSIANTGIMGIEPLSALVLAESGSGASSVPIRVSLARSGDNAEQSATVRVWLASASKATRVAPPDSSAGLAKATVSWKAGQGAATVTVSPSVPAGVGGDLVVIARIDDDAIAGDNIASRPIEAKSSLQVALVGPGNETTGSALDRFKPRDWFALSLAPEQSFGSGGLGASGVRISRLEARDFVGATTGDSGVPAFLRGMSALVITEPQLLDPGAWRIVRNAAAQGVAIMIVPPEEEQAQTWADAMSQALGTTWVLSRSVRTIDGAGATEAATLSAETQAQGDDDLLSLVRSELEDLIRPIHVFKVVPIESGLSRSQVLVTLRDGSPLIVASRASVAGAANPGWVVLWLASPSLAWTDLPAKPLMVPLSQELVRQAVGRSAGRQEVAAGVIAGGARNSAGGANVQSDAQIVEYAPAVVWKERPDPTGLISVGRSSGQITAIRDAGIYLARNERGVGVRALSVNAPAAAGNTTPVSEDQVGSWLAGIGGGSANVEFLNAGDDRRTSSAASGDAGAPKTLAENETSGWRWSFWLLVAAGVLAALEAVLARVFSHATQRSDASAQGVVS